MKSYKGLLKVDVGAPLLAGLILLGLLAGFPGAAEADKGKASAPAQEAQQLFSAGKYQQAAQKFEEAYSADPKPEYLYNRAQCFKQLGGLENLKKARFSLEGFLKNKPDAPNRKQVEQEIAELGRQVEMLEAVRRPVTATPASLTIPSSPAPQAKPFYKKWWFWTIVGAVVAGATATTVVLTQPEDVPAVSGTMSPGQIQFD